MVFILWQGSGCIAVIDQTPLGWVWVVVWVVVVVGACCGDYKFNRGASGNCDYDHSGCGNQFCWSGAAAVVVGLFEIISVTVVNIGLVEAVVLSHMVAVSLILLKIIVAVD